MASRVLTSTGGVNIPCSRTQTGTSGNQTANLLIPSLTLYQKSSACPTKLLLLSLSGSMDERTSHTFPTSV